MRIRFAAVLGRTIVLLIKPTPRQNALRMSKNLSFRSVTHFRLCIKIQCKQAKIPYREV